MGHLATLPALSESRENPLRNSKKGRNKLPTQNLPPTPQKVCPSPLCYSCAQKNEMKSDCDEFERQKKQQSPFLLPRAMRISEQCYVRCMKMIQNESHRIEKTYSSK